MLLLVWVCTFSKYIRCRLRLFLLITSQKSCNGPELVHLLGPCLSISYFNTPLLSLLSPLSRVSLIFFLKLDFFITSTFAYAEFSWCWASCMPSFFNSFLYQPLNPVLLPCVFHSSVYFHRFGSANEARLLLCLLCFVLFPGVLFCSMLYCILFGDCLLFR